VPLGYEIVRGRTVSEKSHVEIDQAKAPLIKQMFEWVAYDGFSGRRVWDYIHEKGLRTKNGKKLSLSMIFRILSTTFYY